MTAKYTVLDSQVLATSAASVTFSSIPGGYKDLVLVISGTTPSFGQVRLNFNSDIGANYYSVQMRGSGSAASSATTAGETFFSSGPNTDFSTTIGMSVDQIIDYSATDKHKTILRRSGSTYGVGTLATAGRWANSVAVVSITVSTSAANFAAGSTFRLLGVN